MTDNLPSRPQSANAAFTLQKTYPSNECLEAADEPYSAYCTKFKAQAPVKSFTDAKTWYPGIEMRDGAAYARDNDASVVLPSRDNAPYTTRVTHPDGSPAPEFYGVTLGGGAIVLGTGDPGDQRVNYGVSLTIKKAARDNSSATVYVTPARN